MKKKVYVPLILSIGASLFITSCSQDDDIVEQPIEKTTLSAKQREIFREKLDSTLVKMYSHNNNLSKNLSLQALPQASFDKNGSFKSSNLTEEHYMAAIKKVGNETGLNVAPRIHGPFTHTSHYQLLRTNKRVAVEPINGYPPYGYYFADIYQYHGWYNAPAEAITGYADNTPTTQWGWGFRTEDGFGEENRGIVFSFTHYGNYMMMFADTYSMHIKANMLGQTFSLTRPFNFREAILEYKFYYITL